MSVAEVLLRLFLPKEVAAYVRSYSVREPYWVMEYSPSDAWEDYLNTSGMGRPDVRREINEVPCLSLVRFNVKMQSLEQKAAPLEPTHLYKAGEGQWKPFIPAKWGFYVYLVSVIVPGTWTFLVRTLDDQGLWEFDFLKGPRRKISSAKSLYSATIPNDICFASEEEKNPSFWLRSQPEQKRSLNSQLHLQGMIYDSGKVFIVGYSSKESNPLEVQVLDLATKTCETFNHNLILAFIHVLEGQVYIFNMAEIFKPTTAGQPQPCYEGTYHCVIKGPTSFYMGGRGQSSEKFRVFEDLPQDENLKFYLDGWLYIFGDVNNVPKLLKLNVATGKRITLPAPIGKFGRNTWDPVYI